MSRSTVTRVLFAWIACAVGIACSAASAAAVEQLSSSPGSSLFSAFHSCDTTASSATPAATERASAAFSYDVRAHPLRERLVVSGGVLAAKAGRRSFRDLDLDALSRSGQGRVGRKLEQHQGGKFPTVSGGPKAKEALGQDLLDDILTAPGSRIDDVTSGNFSGGFRVISPDGRGATFDSTGKLQYFGEY